MKKEFNTSGVCYPEEHYMMDNSSKLKEILQLIEGGKYFVINRPRQYGKTTTLNLLEKQLQASSSYMPVTINFQGIDRKWYEKDETFAVMIATEMSNYFEFEDQAIFKFMQSHLETIQDMGTLSKFITYLVLHLRTVHSKKLILLIDEVDASSDYIAFLTFLGMLRTKFLARKNKRQATFHSVILAGVHDIKSLKYKLRNPKEAKYNSPWNITTDFEVDLAFRPQEIVPMLKAYCAAEGMMMDVPAIAEKLYYYTSGHPFLISKLCKNIVDKIVRKSSHKTDWTLEDVDTSVQLTLKEDNTNFDSLIKNLENNTDLYDLAHQILIDGKIIPFSPDEAVAKLGRIYGVFKANGRLKIHNRIYEQRIYNYMIAKTLNAYSEKSDLFDSATYSKPNTTLDLERVLRKFQSFMKVQRSNKDTNFIERQWRLIFLAFLQPIINGKGYGFKEVEISEEKRLDIALTYQSHFYIVELKLWRGKKSHENGLQQLSDYLDIHRIQEGYLIIFDNRKTKTWEAKWLSHNGKKIFAVWV